MRDKTIGELVDEGYAVVLFNPEELCGACPTKIEDRLIELGWDVIGQLKVNIGEDE